MIVLDGPIGAADDADESPPITSAVVARLLSECNDESPLVLLTSWGGRVRQGIEIHDVIRADPRLVTVRIRRIAASAAAVVAMAGARIEIEADALLMLHSAWGFCPSVDLCLEAMGGAIDAMNVEAARRLARVTGRTVDAERADLESGCDRWLDSRQALACGYVHAIVPPQTRWFP